MNLRLSANGYIFSPKESPYFLSSLFDYSVKQNATRVGERGEGNILLFSFS